MLCMFHIGHGSSYVFNVYAFKRDELLGSYGIINNNKNLNFILLEVNVEAFPAYIRI